jgi:hypothetical protein
MKNAALVLGVAYVAILWRRSALRRCGGLSSIVVSMALTILWHALRQSLVQVRSNIKTVVELSIAVLACRGLLMPDDI